jgi:(2R)-3-sulfolactate dehydrogenase (NADP+)
MTQLLTLPDVRALACDCLTRAGAPDKVARAVAAEVAAAEAAGDRRHGMEALLRDLRLMRYGRILAGATPRLSRPRPGLLHLDAGHGFAAAALAGAIDDLVTLARDQGVAMLHLDHASDPGTMLCALAGLSAHGLTGIGPTTRSAIPQDVIVGPRPAPRDRQPADSPFGAPVAHEARLIALTQDGDTAPDPVGRARRENPVALAPTAEIALPTDLLEQIVTA